MFINVVLRIESVVKNINYIKMISIVMLKADVYVFVFECTD